ncbi:MAG: flagellar hook-associated protein FlgK, partial [Methylobacter sp.]
MSGLLSTSLSGLTAAQRSLETVQHNISNVNTEGYSRQRVEQGTNPAMLTGDGYIGQGVDVTNITRSYDQFINKQLSSSISAFGEVDHYHLLASRIDNITADPSTGIAPSMNRFFNALNEVANDPTSIPSRQVLLSEAGVLTQNFNTMNNRFEEIRTQNNNDMRGMVDDINSLAKSIANLNVQIADGLGKGQGIRQPNDLLDQQDALLSKLAAIVNVSVVPQKDGTSSVFIGNGQALVLRGSAAEFTTLQSEFDPGRLEIGIKTAGSTQDVTNQITGGSLGGALRFRDEVLDPSQQKLGRVAVGLAMEINATHKNGFDLNGTAGLDLFKFSGVATVPVTPSSLNTGNAVVTANFQNSNPLAASSLDYSDYKLTYVNAGSGVDYTLTRIRDNQVMNLTATTAGGISTLSFAATQPANFNPAAFAMTTSISPGTFTPAVSSDTTGNPFTLQVDGLPIYTEAPSTGGTVTANELDAALNTFLTTGPGAGIYFKTGSFATNDLVLSKSGTASILTISSN